jgi:V/A-type H+-transporting ATPase subunit A
VRCFWGLDRDLAQARFFPAIDPLTSYSEDVDKLTRWWQARDNPDWPEYRRRILALLEQHSRLQRMARIVGKDALPPRQQLTLLCADIVNDAFLRQSAFSPVDRYCSPERQTGLMRLILHFVDRAESALEDGVELSRIIDMPVLRRLQRASEEIPEERLRQLQVLLNRVDEDFDDLETRRRRAS